MEDLGEFQIQSINVNELLHGRSGNSWKAVHVLHIELTEPVRCSRYPHEIQAGEWAYQVGGRIICSTDWNRMLDRRAAKPLIGYRQPLIYSDQPAPPKGTGRGYRYGRSDRGRGLWR